MQMLSKSRRNVSMLTKLVSAICIASLFGSGIAFAAPPLPDKESTEALIQEAGVANIMTVPQKASFIEVGGGDIGIKPFAIDGKISKAELTTFIILPIIAGIIAAADNNNWLGTSSSSSSGLASSDGQTFNCGVLNSGSGDVNCDFSNTGGDSSGE